MGKTRKKGPKTPGVTLIKPTATRGWRARFKDADGHGHKWETLDPALTTAELRADWAVRKSKALARRRIELEQGAPRALGAKLAVAVERFFQDQPQLRESTRALYRLHANTFLVWAAANGLAKGDDLIRPHLVAFKASRLRVKRRASIAGATKGAKQATAELRAPASVNVELRSVATVLQYLRELGLLARLSRDDLRDGLKRIEASREAPAFLKQADMVALLKAALAHDAATFAATREEHAGLREPGQTPRYPTIAPFVACVLLSGMRLDEALSLEWERVDLAAKDSEGQAVGAIALTTATKTKRPRTIGLEVSPGLRELLLALRPEGATGSVFGLTRGAARAAARRLERFDAPNDWSWQVLRSTCGTYLTNSPGIFGGASAYQSAKQLGHSVQIAERHYTGLVRGIPREARTLEAATGIEAELRAIIHAAASSAK